MKAYPFLHKHPTTGETTLAQGMDLRDYFAGLAMQDFMMQADKAATTNGYWEEDWRERVALDAYMMADAMMKQRENKYE
jgi:hypothetical protein